MMLIMTFLVISKFLLRHQKPGVINSVPSSPHIVNRMVACLHRMYSEAVKPVYLLSAHHASQGYEKKLGRMAFLDSCFYALWIPLPWENMGDPSTFHWLKWELIPQQDYLEILTCVARSVKGTGTRLMLAKSKARDSWDRVHAGWQVPIFWRRRQRRGQMWVEVLQNRPGGGGWMIMDPPLCSRGTPHPTPY